jgi:hypothetical protein
MAVSELVQRCFQPRLGGLGSNPVQHLGDYLEMLPGKVFAPESSSPTATPCSFRGRFFPRATRPN